MTVACIALIGIAAAFKMTGNPWVVLVGAVCAAFWYFILGGIFT